MCSSGLCSIKIIIAPAKSLALMIYHGFVLKTVILSVKAAV